MIRHHFRALAAAATLTVLLGTGLAAPGGSASAVPSERAQAQAPSPSAPTRASRWEPRPEQFSETVKTTDVPIRMDDGVVLRGDLTLPATADGEPAKRRLPVLVMITAYNKTVIAGGGGGLSGGDPNFLVKRGYAYLVVDARGTGSSAGGWEAFSARENKDAGKIVGWAHRQPWSNGKVGMIGASYMGISQLMAAGHEPPGLKAIFPQVPGIDVYRDIVASGGQIDVGFIPLWLGLVHTTGLIPPAYAASDPSALGNLLEHLISGGTFTLPLVLSALAGGDSAYDGPFYRERSAGSYLKDVTVPTFLVGGEHDLFQRGTPMIFEKLQRNGAPVKMIIGPWDHLEGSAGAKVVDAGYGTLTELHLRWFDHWIKGKDTALDEIAPVTYFEQGSDEWRTARTWVDRTKGVHTRLLSGTSMQGGKYGGLTKQRAVEGSSTMLPLPVSGLCSRSANQWTAGILNMIWADNPCFTNNNINDYTGLTFQTRRLTRAVQFRGPINAHLFVSSAGGDGMLSVAVEDVAPDGTVSRITGGWQVISQRKLIKARSRYIDGKLIQPWHPFSRAAKSRLKPGQVVPVDVEIFPTAAVIERGHRLRFTVQGFDVPHLLGTIPDIPGSLLPITLYAGPEHPSSISLPGRQLPRR